jgi:acyl-CoA reductase-like NAD-dependent aldehyde dehydrogenase
MGPLISEKQLRNVERLVNGALDGGNAVSLIGAKMDVFTILFLSLLDVSSVGS